MRGGLGRSVVLRSLRVPAGDSEGGGCEAAGDSEGVARGTRVILGRGSGTRWRLKQWLAEERVNLRE
jgi:hypothetical protein